MTVSVKNPQAPDPEALALVEDRIRDITQQTAELHALLARYAASLEHEGLHQQLALLDEWMKTSAEGMNVTAKVFDMGPDWLDNLHGQLTRATLEIERLLAEGSDPQAAMEVWSGVNAVLESLSALFSNREKS